MKQHIDFFKSQPKTPIQLPAKWITLTTIASLVLCMLISLDMALNVLRDNKLIKHILAENIRVTHDFQKAANAYPLLAGNKSLVEQLGELEKKLHDKKDVFARITHKALRFGFSNYLQTLANIVPEGLWLSDIALNQETKTATISGYTINPVAVSTLLQALQDSTVFTGLTFHLFYLKQVPEKSYGEFRLATNTLATAK